MDLNINLNEVNYSELIDLCKKTQDFIQFLDNEINTSEVEKKTK